MDSQSPNNILVYPLRYAANLHIHSMQEEIKTLTVYAHALRCPVIQAALEELKIQSLNSRPNFKMLC